MTQKSAVAENTTSVVPMTAEQRASFDRDGYLLIRGALGPDEAAAAREAIDRVYASMARAGSLAPDGSMHLLSAVANCPEVAGLIDHPATFPWVWSVLGWNIHIYHSHLPGELDRRAATARHPVARSRRRHRGDRRAR